MKIVSNVFPLNFVVPDDKDVKDPCLVHDGALWHIFGSGGTVKNETAWSIVHVTSESLEGPWTEHDVTVPHIDGTGVAAPGVIWDEKDRIFHMFIQTEFMKDDGWVHHLVSDDGDRWMALQQALLSVPGTNEAGIYDPHPSIIRGRKYIAYSGFPPKGENKFVTPDIYLARSTTNTWYGPYERVRKILDHDEVPHQNKRGDPEYEWGLEGAQIVHLRGKVYMTGTCFRPDLPKGNRQRVFLATADDPEGPYTDVKLVMDLPDGENGHSSLVIEDDNHLLLCYQSRLKETGGKWRYGIARIAL